jgi:hypothetical protein
MREAPFILGLEALIDASSQYLIEHESLIDDLGENLELLARSFEIGGRFISTIPVSCRFLHK